MRRSFSLLCRQGICLLLAASYIICLCAASLNAAPTVAEAGSIASLELLPRAENPHLSPDDPALAASIPETSGKNLQSPAAPPLADPPFFAEDSIIFSRRIMQRRAACV